MTRIEFLFRNLTPGVILDIGNLGRHNLIHERLFKEFPDSEIHGIDINDQASYGLNFPHQAIGNADHMPYKDAQFDTVFLGEVLEHTWTPKRMVEECYRVLKPGGVFILTTPNIYALSRMLRYLVKGEDVILGGPEHKIFFSRAMLDNILKKSNFKSVSLFSDSKCTVKGRSFMLPRWGPFAYMGEHLVAKAIK
jgi:SAM-dependent methyltransferase